ncbi:MAG: hypothetical protein ACYCS8_15670, partial [Acidithiobacillus sp.]
CAAGTFSVSPMPSPMISSVHVLGDHSAPLKNPEYNAAQLPLTDLLHFREATTTLTPGVHHRLSVAAFQT